MQVGRDETGAAQDLQRRAFRVWPFAGWIAAGVLWGFSLAAAFSFGLFVMPAALILTVYLCLGYHRPEGWPGVIGGFAVIGFYLAFLHRHGPGTSCTTTATTTECTDLLDPWPLLVGGVVLAIGCALVTRWWYTRWVTLRYRR